MLRSFHDRAGGRVSATPGDLYTKPMLIKIGSSAHSTPIKADPDSCKTVLLSAALFGSPSVSPEMTKLRGFHAHVRYKWIVRMCEFLWFERKLRFEPTSPPQSRYGCLWRTNHIEVEVFVPARLGVLVIGGQKTRFRPRYPKNTERCKADNKL